jgi:putative solute:sodium symporter small subunit
VTAPPASDPATSDPPHWRRVRAITGVLLAVWALVTFATTFFARELTTRWFGFPLNWWIAAQGALLVYVLLIGVFAWAMGRLDDDADDGAA